jgi:hypothetical protein
VLEVLWLGDKRSWEDMNAAHVYLKFAPTDLRSAVGGPTVSAEVAGPGEKGPDSERPSDGGA